MSGLIPNTQINRSSIYALCMNDLQDDMIQAIPSLLRAASVQLTAAIEALK